MDSEVLLIKESEKKNNSKKNLTYLYVVKKNKIVTYKYYDYLD